MSSAPFRKAAAYVGLWGGVIFFVVLLTMVFSFLGTLICAALAGMMMGATKPSYWLSVPMSLLFPVIIFTVLHVTKVELSHQQVVLVSGLCFGGFWGLYFGASFLMAFEQKQASPNAVKVTDSVGVQAAPSNAPEATAGAEVIKAPPLFRELNLAELQGTWVCQDSANGSLRGRIIEISGNRVVLSIVDGNERLKETASGQFRLVGDAAAGERTAQ